MNRKKGTALLATGIVLVAVTLAGVFAASSDSADTGTLSVEAGAQATLGDLQINQATVGAAANCSAQSAYVENQTTAPMTVVNADPGTADTKYLCLKNAGADVLNLTLDLINTASTETACGPDEPQAEGGPDCGVTGEVADDVDVVVTRRGTSATGGCGAAAPTPGNEPTYTGVADASGAVLGGTAIPPGGYSCVRVVATYRASTPVLEVYKNQTDKVSWAFRFTGTTS